ncbi:uncharacterized protein LOC127866462 [Dreissena polymorpha]|uniref:uncharacterized protein LOC127866462 n=1 Tax=Dreissena polymorpha TaxID=45954 RepID=UPI0022655084|nr:uncharacterized protein LOC127866462 [Dreissena polymorpha]
MYSFMSLCSAGILALNGEGKAFEFAYLENEQDPVAVADVNASLDGSYISLGEWPHWCLGNMSLCLDGVTVDMWFKFADIPEDSPEMIVFSTGGHSWYSNGIYLLQRYGDELELGIAFNEDLWAVKFRVEPEVWVNIHAFWDVFSGLTLLTPKYEQQDTTARNYQELTYTAFPEVVVGLSLDGSPVTDTARFEVSTLRVYSWISQTPSDGIDENKLWLACGASLSKANAVPVPQMAAVERCREICSASTVAGVSGGFECICTSMSAVANLHKDILLCNNATDWHFYTVSGLAESDIDYSISVSVQKLGVKEYVKPFEAVEIHISTDFAVNVPLFVDFGDGNTETITDKTISYYWRNAGKYDITVSAAVGITQITGSVDFVVESRNEGYAGDYAMLIPNHGSESRLSVVDFINIDNETAMCDILYGDVNASAERRAGLSKFVETAELQHRYGLPGRYRMNIECHNPFGSISNETHFIARKFEQTEHFLKQGLSFRTNVSGDSSFFQNVMAAHQDPTFGISARVENQSQLVLDQDDLRIQENFVTFSFKDVIIDKRIISVQNELKKPIITSPKADGAWNLTTAITVTIPPGNNIFVNVSFGVGVGEIFYIHYQPNVTAIEFMVNFTDLGYYDVSANISNDVSYSTASLLVSVEVPLTTISLSISDVVDKESPVALMIDVNGGERGPMKINFEIDHGNGFIDTYAHDSNTFFFPTYRHEYVYPEWGDYMVCVRAFNNLGSVLDCIQVQVGERITYVDVTTPTAGRFKPEETVTTLVRCPRGSDKTFRVDFGDGETFVFSDRYLKETENFLDTTTTTVDGTTMSPFSTKFSSTANSVGTEISTMQQIIHNRRRRDDNKTDIAQGNTFVMLDMSTIYHNETSASLSAITTTEVPTTTTMIVTTTTPPATMEPLPVDVVYPHMTNDSTAKSLRDGVIVVTHKYNRTGTFSVRVTAFNAFNWAQDELCPDIIVATAPSNDNCQTPTLTVLSKLESAITRPLHFLRSEQINLTATVALDGCGAVQPTFSWRTDVIVEENGKIIQRPYHDTGICVLETVDKIFKYPRSSLPFGKYVATLVVSPVGRPLKFATLEFYFVVNPSPPYAIIENNAEHLWFLVYGTTMIKFHRSVDPDFNSTEGIDYDLVLLPEKNLPELKLMTNAKAKSLSTLVTESVTNKYTSKNRIRLYEYTRCFKSLTADVINDIRFPTGQFYVPSEHFSEKVPSFALMLYVSKNSYTTSAYVTFEIRLSNASNLLDQLDDLLASKDTSGVMRAVTALADGLIVQPTNASEEANFEAQAAMTELKAKLIGALDSVSEGVADIGQASGMIGLVGDLTKDSSSVSDSARVGATSAIKNSALVTEQFADEPMDTLTNVGSQVVSSVSNVLPKPDATALKLAEHEKALHMAEADAKAAQGPTDEEIANGEDSADIKLQDDPEELTALTEEDMATSAPLPYNKLLKKCDLLHSAPLDKLYKYLFFYESIFRQVLKNVSEEIMVSEDILKLPRNDIFCYIGILEEPGDVEWYYNRYFDAEKRRRDLVKKNADRGVSNSFLAAIDSVSSVLLNKTEANQTVELSAPGLKVAMKRASANGSSEDEGPIGGGGAGVKMPLGVLSGSGNDSEVGQTLIMNDDNPFTYGNENDTTSIGTGVVTFKLSTPGTKNAVPVSNTTEPIEIYLATNPSLMQRPLLYTLILKKGDSQSSMVYHPLNVTGNDTTLHMIIRPEVTHSTDLFDVFIQYETRPNETHFLARTKLPHAEDAFSLYNITWETEDTVRHTFYPDPELTRKAGMYYIGVRLRSGKVDLMQSETMFNYTYQHFLGGCRFWNHENETWDSDGCVVGNLTTPNATQCLCNHLTSFGGNMVVPPNTIDFNNVWAKFKNLNENAAVFSTIVSLLGIYVIGLIWARHMDKKDLIKWGATPLEDNLPTDNYHYQLSVYTGMKKDAATKSNVSFIISGEERDTGVRRLFDGKRLAHDTGSIMNYVLSVEEKLGPLSFCRIWHDNSADGKFRSWYLEQIEVSDLQTGEKYFFLCNRWLACEEDDGMVDRILPVASIEDLVAFKQLFSSSIRKKITSDHLWVSVFSRPTRSSFTRVQRISCCMSLLFLTMITNAMWFKSDGEKGEQQNQQTVSITIGPISVTLQQIFISLMSTIIVFPPSFLLITLFRRTKQKTNTVMQANQSKPKRGRWKNLGTASSVWEDAPTKSKLTKFKESISELVKGNSKTKYDTQEEEEDNIPVPTIAGDPNAKANAQKKKKKPFMFPYWCNYIAWILCFLSVITPAFFTILYSMEWGKTKANEWLVTFVLSFFQSVIVVQPIKVLCLVTFIACVLKKPDLDEESDCTNELNQAIATHEAAVTAKGSDALDEIARRRREANEALDPPDSEKLEEQRVQRVREMKMEAILKEIMVYGFFVLVLFFLSYQQRDVQSFYYTENMKNMFVEGFEEISTMNDYWVWLEGTLMPTLYASQFHNGTNLTNWWDKRCVGDFQSRRMGIARLRQFRIKEDSCNILGVMEPVINHCRTDYNWLDDDTAPYLPAWRPVNEKDWASLEERTDDPFVYQNSIRLKSMPYMATLRTYKGGGYVVNFERSFRRTARNLTRLREQDWLDLRTRAIILEFTVYNPNANLFASAIMTTEFPATGAAVPRSEFKIFRLQNYVGGFGIVVIFFEVLYCCFALLFFYRCIKKVRQLKCMYFQTFWEIMEFIMLCFAVACIVMYVFKYTLTKVAFHYLKKQSQPEFINFQSLAMYDEFYGFMTACVVFLASLQFLKLLSFNKKMNMLGETVKLATKDLKVFSIAFLLYFMSFVLTSYLLFGKYMAGYSGFVQSVESTFAFTLGTFDFDAMSGAHKFLGPVFFFTFIMVIYVGLMSIFLTIIGDAFSTVKEQTKNAENEYEMVDFIWRKFKGIIGVK